MQKESYKLNIFFCVQILLIYHLNSAKMVLIGSCVVNHPELFQERMKEMSNTKGKINNTCNYWPVSINTGCWSVK